MPDSPCVFCGQCIGVCPTGALKPKIEFGLQQGWSEEEIRQATRQPRRRKNSDEA
jgi:formate hydrogenlyase subunit 6/NADH:ubiquinone oxidoreductase subunit I